MGLRVAAHSVFIVSISAPTADVIPGTIMTESESDHEKNDVQGAEWGQDVVSDERSPNNESKPLFSFGAIADVQHADIEDGWNWHKTRRRYYRGGLLQLKLAVDTWLTDENHRLLSSPEQK